MASGRQLHSLPQVPHSAAGTQTGGELSATLLSHCQGVEFLGQLLQGVDPHEETQLDLEQ